VTGQVQQRSGGRTVEIDTGMLKDVYNGSGNALIIEGDRLTVTNQDGRTGLALVEHPIRIGHASIPLDDDGLANILSSGTLVELPGEAETRRIVKVTSDDLTVIARFRESRGDGFTPEIAAYTVDRMLRLGMVPVTIRRALDGQEGTLQLLPDDAVSDAALAGIRGRIEAPCSIDKQAATMRVFDALIGNTGRTPSTMLYDPDDLLLILVSHGAAFGAGTAWSGYFLNPELTVGEQWRTALRELDDDTLRKELGDLLGEERLAGLERRRDALLNNSATDAAH
jgi:hypothetical protein